MKPSIILLPLGLIIIAGSTLYLKRPHEISPPAEVAPTQTASTAAPILEPVTAVPEVELLPPTSSMSRSVEATVPDPEPPANPNPAPESSAVNRVIDTLISPQSTFAQKQAVWQQLRESGQLASTIEALKAAAKSNPNSAAYPAALGQAQLFQAGVVAQQGGAINEMGMLGMQADQNFDAALKLDPSNWEAQFFKAAAMSYWPLELNKGEEVVQRLSGLIDQQEKMPAQPQFAQTYILLGDQYRKMGNAEYATATWQLGVMKFPGDATLQSKITGQ